MSRKHAKNRNHVRIGIFEGKSAEYNKAILEVLYEQGYPLTSWQVAKSLQKKLKPISNEKAAQMTAHHIYSVIQRKGGRLQELQKKRYILSEDRRWHLSRWKGRLALFIKKPQLLDKLSMETYRQGFKLMRETTQAPADTQIKLPFGMTVSVDGDEFRRGIKNLLTRLETNPSTIRLIVEETKLLLKEGVDLDLITDESLVALLVLRKSVKKALKKFL